MKLGVSYNLWKGEELLPHSIKAIREHVDYIVVVYQNLSNFKQERDDLEPFLEGLMFEGLIDEVVFYEPDFTDIEEAFWGIHNELRKRNIGLQKCLSNGCTHLIDLDTDEIYETTPFVKCKEMIMSMGYDGSFCQNITYYKFPNCVIYPPETKYTPFIYKIGKKSKFEPLENEDFPVLTDGKRRIKTAYAYVFPRSELELHHFSYVRNNDTELTLKFQNCSSNMNFSSQRVKDIINVYNKFEIGDEVIFGLDETYSTKEVENKFNIVL